MKITNILISLVLLVCAAAAFYYFWRDFTGTLTMLNEEPIAEVTLKNRTVQRRFEGRLNWSMLDTKSLLYNGDVVRTGENAGVAIRFVSGDSLQLDRESMVQIFWTKAEGVQIDVASGENINVRSISDKPVVIVSGTKKVEVQRGEEKSIAVAESGAISEKREVQPVETLSETALAETAVEEAKEAEKRAEFESPSPTLPPEPEPLPEEAPEEQPQQEQAPQPPPEPIRARITNLTQNLNKNSNTVALEWEEETAVKNGKIVLKNKDNAFSAGDYTWTLEAKSASGSDLSAEKPGSFTVPAETPLGAPQNLLPEQNHAIDRAALEASRSLSLSWDPVPGASAYIVTLRKEGEGVFYQSPPLKQTSYTVEDVMVHGEGKTTWQVEAVRLDNAGAIAQRGPAASSSYIIELPPLAAPEPVE